MRLTNILVAGILTISLARTSHAEVIVAPSIDWLVVKSDVICIGQVRSVETKALRKDVWIEKVSIKVTNSIQLCRTDEILSFAYQVSDASIRSKEWLFSKDGVLVLLRKTTLSERYLDSSLTPVSTRRPLTAVDLSTDLHIGFFTKDFRKLTIGSEIKSEILAARDRLIKYREENPKTKINPVRVTVPGDSEMHKELYADSAVMMTLPAYLGKSKK